MAGSLLRKRSVAQQPGSSRHYARDTNARTLADVIGGADVFLGLSAGGVLRPEMVKQMGETPLIMALANPTPEIEPGLALAARPDAMICTGRSDYPNQVNNVLCFPYSNFGMIGGKYAAPRTWY